LALLLPVGEGGAVDTVLLLLPKDRLQISLSKPEISFETMVLSVLLLLLLLLMLLALLPLLLLLLVSAAITSLLPLLLLSSKDAGVVALFIGMSQLLRVLLL
jgi:hypothetical protein